MNAPPALPADALRWRDALTRMVALTMADAPTPSLYAQALRQMAVDALMPMDAIAGKAT